LCHGYIGVKDLYLPDNARVLNKAGSVVMTFRSTLCAALLRASLKEHHYGYPKRPSPTELALLSLQSAPAF
jgi:hypothetical protein